MSVFCSFVILLGSFSLSSQMNVTLLKSFKVGKPGPEGIELLFNYSSTQFIALTAGTNNRLHGPVVSKLALFRSFKKIGVNLNDYENYKYAVSFCVHKSGEAFESAEFRLDSKYTSVLLFTQIQRDAPPLKGRREVQLKLANAIGRSIEVTGYVVKVYVNGVPVCLLAVYRDALGSFEFIPDKTNVSSGSTTYEAMWDENESNQDKLAEDAENIYLEPEKKEALPHQRKEIRRNFRSTWFVFTQTSPLPK